MDFGYSDSGDLESKLDDICSNLDLLRGQVIDIFQTPVETIHQYDPSDIYGIGASAIHAWIHFQDHYPEITQYSGTTHNREGYPDFQIDGTDMRVELKTVFDTHRTLGDIGEGYESSARFEERADSIQEGNDLFLIFSWYLTGVDGTAKIKIGNYRIRPAVEVAIARDRRQINNDGFFDANTGEPYVSSNKKSTSEYKKETQNGETLAVKEEEGGYNKDTNFGKAYRIGHDEIEEFVKNDEPKAP